MVRFYHGTTVGEMLKIMKGSTHINTYATLHLKDAYFFAQRKAEQDNMAPAVIMIDIPSSEIKDFRLGHIDGTIVFTKPLDPKYITGGVPIRRTSYDYYGKR